MPVRSSITLPGVVRPSLSNLSSHHSGLARAARLTIGGAVAAPLGEHMAGKGPAVDDDGEIRPLERVKRRAGEARLGPAMSAGVAVGWAACLVAGTLLAGQAFADVPSATVIRVRPPLAAAPTAPPTGSSSKPVGHGVPGNPAKRSPAGVATVPDMRGLDLGVVPAVLRTAGLRQGPVTYEDAPMSPDGTVVRTDPPAGTLLPAGSAVTLVCARATEVSAPDLVGRSADDASRRLRELGLTVRVTRVPGGPDQADRVIGQDPPPGRRIAAGAAVTLRVGQPATAPRSPSQSPSPSLPGTAS